MSAGVTKKAIIEDVKQLAEDLDSTKITKGIYRKEGKFPNQVSQCFKSWGELMMAAGMKPTAGERQYINKRVKAEETKLIEEWYAKELLPYHRKHYKAPSKEGITTVAMASDWHSIHMDFFMRDMFLDTIKRRQPNYVILLGDVYNFASYSRFPERPSECDVKTEMDFVKREIYAPITKACPNARIILVAGNHGVRLFKAIARDMPYMLDLLDYNGITMADLLGLDEFNIDYVGKLDFVHNTQRKVDKMMQRNHLTLFKDLFTFVHIPKANLGTHSASGHTHHSVSSTSGNALGVYTHQTLGCMCELDLEYVEGVDTSNNGFGFAFIDPEKRQVYQEPVVVTNGMAVIDGIVYNRNK